MPPSPSGSTKADPQKRIRRQVARTIADLGLIRQGDAVVVGVSGGPDSVALLLLLADLRPAIGMELAVAHLDHGLRPEAGADEAAGVRALAGALDLPCHIRRADTRAVARRMGLGIEAAGRWCRYRFFRDLCRIAGYDRIALGHQGDDNAEQVLINLLRGSGPSGLAGIPPRRGDRFVRPLIRLGRADTLAYLEAGNTPFVIDPSNDDTRFLRNRVRHDLIPHLRDRYNPQIVQVLNRMADILREEEGWLQTLIEPLYEAVVTRRGTKAVSLDIARIDTLHPAARRRLIRLALDRIKGDLKRIGFAHILAICDLIRSKTPRARLDLPDHIRVQRDKNELVIQWLPTPLRETGDLNRPVAPVPFTLQVDSLPGTSAPPLCLDLPEAGRGLRLSILPLGHRPEFHKAGQGVAFFDMDFLSLPLTVRSIRAGDRFTPLGMGSSLSVRRYLAGHRMAARRHAATPVLVSGGRIIWLVGLQIDESAKIHRKTRQILMAEVTLA
jgi:tRNA(Ile)-lysidine synthase